MTTQKHGAAFWSEAAIDMFLEYLHVHGHDEDSARSHAVNEMVDGESAITEMAEAKDSSLSELLATLAELYPGAVISTPNITSRGDEWRILGGMGSNRWEVGGRTIGDALTSAVKLLQSRSEGAA